LRKITVRSRLGEIPGFINESTAETDTPAVAFFDRFDAKAGRVVRHFVFIDEAVKLMHEPWDWKDRWYIDLVEVRWADENTLELDDLYVDVIVEGNGPIYRMIDLEELADALRDQKISVERIHEPLCRLQRFLDEHLHGGKDFPPEAIRGISD
jgi:predicted RNA-binding protein associated with RNAse of E/G family